MGQSLFTSRHCLLTKAELGTCPYHCGVKRKLSCMWTFIACETFFSFIITVGDQHNTLKDLFCIRISVILKML